MNTMANNTIKIHIDIDPAFDIIAERYQSVNIKSATQEAIEEYAFSVERESKIETPVDTGRLRSSIVTDIGNLHARVAPHVNYAVFVHEGTKYMKGRPFMSLGLTKASIKLFGSSNPFTVRVEQEINNKLK